MADCGSSSVTDSARAYTDTIPYEPRALPFIQFDQTDEKFKVSAEAAQLISTIQKPIGVCSVAGMYRTGKSYLLNRMLLEQSQGFGVGPTINPCTKGLWVWSEPIKGTSKDGEPINVLVVDTEGLGAFDETQNHDVRIFTLAILLSSSFIYNSVGSIDESSLNQLSLVINLTKNIHLKTQTSSVDGNGGDQDPSDFQALFPRFTWVVRDFTLRLQDSQGQPITQNQYLETALREQKGSSESTEQKNRIRRLLKSFFGERECITMVRPLQDETELQNLANVGFDELRPEFRDQVTQLRAQVLGKIKTKTMHGKPLSGLNLVTLANQYVSSINAGSVPNIQSAWTYICKMESQKAYESALHSLTAYIAKLQLPCCHNQLSSHLKEKVAEHVNGFKQKQMHDNSALGAEIQELKQNLKKIGQQALNRNEQESERAMLHFLETSYAPLQRTLLEQEVSVAQFQQCLLEFTQWVEQQAPPGSNEVKALVLKDFLAQVVVHSASQFLQKNQHQHQTELTLARERLTQIESSSGQKHDAISGQLLACQEQLRAASVQETHFKTLAEQYQEQLEMHQRFRKDDTGRLEQELTALQTSTQREVLQKEAQVSEYQRKAQESQRLQIQAASELAKHQALSEQRLQYVTAQLDDSEAKNTKLSSKIEQLQNDLIFNKVGSSSEEVEQLRDKLALLTQENEDKEAALEELQTLNQQQASELSKGQSQISLMQERLQQYELQQSQHEQVIRQWEDQWDSKAQQFLEEQMDVQCHRDQLEQEMKTKLQQAQEQAATQVQQVGKELALKSQSLEFCQQQVGELQNQLVETKKQHEHILRALEEKANHQISEKDTVEESLQSQIQDYADEIKAIRDQAQVELAQVNQALEEQTDLCSSLKAQLQNSKEKSSAQVTSLESQIESLTVALSDLTSQKDQALQQADETHQSESASLQQHISDLETQLELASQLQNSQVSDLNKQATTALGALKEHFSSEKTRLEHKISSIKQEHSAQLLVCQEDHDQAYQTLLESKDDEIQDLAAQYQRQQYQLVQEAKELQKALEATQQQIPPMKEEQAQLLKQDALQKALIKELREGADADSKNSQHELQNLKSQLQTKDTELQHSKANLDALQEQIQRLQRDCQSGATKMGEIQEAHAIKVDELQRKGQQIADDALRQKLEDVQNLALYKQKIEFQDKKIADQASSLEQQATRNDARLRQLKQEALKEQTELKKQFALQLETQDTSHKLKRQKQKQQDQEHSQALKTVQVQKESLENALSQAQQQVQQYAAQLDQDHQQFQMELANVQDQLHCERSLLTQDMEQLKGQLNDVEREYCELQNSSEREKALLEGKCQFLEQQVRQAKQDYMEASLRFEQTTEHITKSQSIGRTSHSPTPQKQAPRESDPLADQTKKQLAQAQKEIDRLQSEHDTLVQKYKNEVRHLQAKHAKEVGELKDQITQKSHEHKSETYVRSLETTRDAQLKKIQDLEYARNQSQTQRNLLVFEHEKEKAQFSVDRELLQQLKIANQELREQLQKKTHKASERVSLSKSPFSDHQRAHPTKSPFQKSPVMSAGGARYSQHSSGVSQSQLFSNIASSQAQPQSNDSTPVVSARTSSTRQISAPGNGSIFVGGLSSKLKQQAPALLQEQVQSEKANSQELYTEQQSESTNEANSKQSDSLVKIGGSGQPALIAKNNTVARKDVMKFSINSQKNTARSGMTQIRSVTNIHNNKQ